ncbi:MAG: selenoneine synthase SenA [Burkholderiaceae bacterium]
MPVETNPDSLRTADTERLHDAIVAQRRSTLLALEPLSAERWLGPCLPVVNPPLWEFGHVGWFHERWCLRERGEQTPADSVLPDADTLYDSTPVKHNTRWGLPLLSPEATHDYLETVLQLSLDRLQVMSDDDPAIYFHRLSLFHEMMHREAFCYSWHTKSYEKPTDLQDPQPLEPNQWLSIPSGTVLVGSPRDSSFVFDNEKWAMPVSLDGFQIMNRVVSAGEFADFILDGGYQTPGFWPSDVWAQMEQSGARLPAYWREQSGRFQIRRFDQWHDLIPELPMTHVSQHEAAAWCQWAGWSLPSEAQWLHAETTAGFSWGRVWEWTASVFEPLPGFSADPYKEYAEPWFHTHRVLKGASLATPDGMRDARFRNFYEPWRADVFNGFRAVRPSR